SRKPISAHYQREAFSITIGAGAAGMMLALVEAVGTAAGRDLLTGEKIAAGRVLHLNAAVTQNELDPQIAGIPQHYGISKADLAGRLFATSVRDAPLRLAVMGANGVAAIDRAVAQRIVDLIHKHAIDVVQLLPWVSFHAVRWNSGTDMDILAKECLC